jgi:hypothetical protein
VSGQPVQILHTGQLLDLSRQLRAAGGSRLQHNFARRIRRAGEPLHSDLQSTVRGLVIRSEGRKANRQGRVPHGGPSPTTRPLRATIAAAIKISVRTTGRPGARIWVDRSLLPADLQKMPRALNDPRGRIRHPVFGNRRRWANQWVTPPLWWAATVNRHRDRMRNEVQQITDDVRRDLA